VLLDNLFLGDLQVLRRVSLGLLKNYRQARYGALSCPVAQLPGSQSQLRIQFVVHAHGVVATCNKHVISWLGGQYSEKKWPVFHFMTRTGNKRIHEFDWLKTILKAV